MRTEDKWRGLDLRRFCSSLLCFLLLGVAPIRAADKSGVSPNSISLPKGPGSIEGLGESFQPTLNTGTAQYGITLNVWVTQGNPPSITNNAGIIGQVDNGHRPK